MNGDLARPVLERLLRRSESAVRKGQAAAVSLPMTEASCPEYARLDSLDALERFHAGVALAERDGAITVTRDAHHGDGSRLRRLAVRDPARLAAHLGITLHADLLAEAVQRLQPWRERVPAVRAAVAAWSAGRKVRGHGPGAVRELLDALRVADDAAASDGGERILRRESVRLFGDSKRIEALTLWLDLLLSDDAAASGLDPEDVWAAYGLRRQPQAMLLAGRIGVRVDGVVLPPVAPYLGLPPERIEALAAPVEWVLSIENLAAFHDAARLASTRPVLVIFTGGMPSPSWMRAWRALLGSLAPDTPLFHWGDMDEGGFRIARHLAVAARALGRSLHPWMMAPGHLPATARELAREPSPAVLARMRRDAEACGWHRVAEALSAEPLLLEQEAVPATLP